MLCDNKETIVLNLEKVIIFIHTHILYNMIRLFHRINSGNITIIKIINGDIVTFIIKVITSFSRILGGISAVCEVLALMPYIKYH